MVDSDWVSYCGFNPSSLAALSPASCVRAICDLCPAYEFASKEFTMQSASHQRGSSTFFTQPRIIYSCNISKPAQRR